MKKMLCIFTQILLFFPSYSFHGAQQAIKFKHQCESLRLIYWYQGPATVMILIVNSINPVGIVN